MDSLQRWKSQYPFYRIFLFSTLKFSALIGLLFTAMAAARFYVNIPRSISAWLYFTPTVGLMFDLIRKELTRKEEYYFYYNHGIDKYKLWAVTFIVMFAGCQLINQLIQLCAQALK